MVEDYELLFVQLFNARGELQGVPHSFALMTAVNQVLLHLSFVVEMDCY